ncbi:MAG: hypothetical protein P8M34_09470 [Saprospiraceae bacterium]|nr:hypothetical protein [Saprospiraceae bacterium]|tara:strand:- start:1268 stop:2005 length:738 start_codon:yes stop_codon:yes gene_type:complete
MIRYIAIILIGVSIVSCGKNCDQEFFFIDLKPTHSLESECIEVGESFNLSLTYTDTLRAFSGVVLTVFDTIYQPNDTIVNSRNEQEINLIDIKNYQFITSITFHRLNDSVSNIDQHSRDLGAFNVAVNRGSEAVDNFDSGNFLSYMPDRNNSISTLDLTVTPQSLGSFYVSIIHGNAGVFDDPIIADGCEDLILSSYMNEGLVNENVLYQATDSSHISDTDLEELVNTKSMFFFKVVEPGSFKCL